MYLELNNEKYFLSSPFTHKVSELRKKSFIKIEFNIYKSEEETSEFELPVNHIELDSELLFFKNLKDLPIFLYFGNNYYFWIFENPNLKNIQVFEDRDYSDTIGKLFTSQKNTRRFIVRIQFEYKQVWGTNNRKVFDRDLLLRNIIE